MIVQFTGVRLEGGFHHQHITRLRAVSDGLVYDDSRAAWVKFIEDGNSGYVRDAYGNTAWVGVRTNGITKWLQTHADGIWTDNLLALPGY